MISYEARDTVKLASTIQQRDHMESIVVNVLIFLQDSF